MPYNSTIGGFWAGVIEFIRLLLWPAGFQSKLGRILGALSMLTLVQYGFEFGLGPTLGLMLEWYENVLGVMLGWAEPFIKASLTELRDFIGWPQMLYSHWKHVFVLLGIYFFREVQLGRYLYGGAYVTFNFLLGLLVAFTFGVVAGTIPLAKSDLVPNFLFAAVLILGAAVYGVVGFVWDATYLRHQYAEARKKPTPTWWGYFSWGCSRILSRSLVGLVLLWVGLQIPIVRQMSSPGLAISAMLVIAFALYWLWDGAQDGKQIRREGESRRAAYWRSRHTQLGIGMLGAFFWGGVFVATNAGLGLFGL